jgi:hypothetical protein
MWPESELQLRNLDLQIAAVWLDNGRPFVELFLFDGPELQGRLTRFARVHTPTIPLPVMLDDPSLKNQARSLLGGEFSTHGRRFSAASEFTDTAQQFFQTQLSGPWPMGTATLTKAPTFSWDGYSLWRQYGTGPKSAALRVTWDFQIEDTQYGATNGSAYFDVVFGRPGGAQPISASMGGGGASVPQPWAGTGRPPDDPSARWVGYMNEVISLYWPWVLGPSIGNLAGPSAGSVFFLPGRSANVPHAASDWELIEIGHTDDDATLVLIP